MFSLRTVAVVGVSSSGVGRQSVFILRIRDLGYSGEIYPIPDPPWRHHVDTSD